MKNGRNKKNRIKLGYTIFLFIGSLSVAAIPSFAAKYTNPVAPKVKVKIAPHAVWDCQPWNVAKDWGFFEDVNIKATIIDMPSIEQPGMEALVAHSIDVACLTELTGPALLPTLEDFTYFLIGDIWKGQRLVIRPESDLKTYNEFLEELGDPEAAIKATAAQLKGKTIVTQLGASSDAPIRGALSAGGLTWDDVNFIDMPYIEAATAFIRGEGDVFTGSLPTTQRTIEAGGVTMLSSGELGGAMMCFVNYTVRKSYLKENEETVLRLLGVWYRTVDFLQPKNPKWDEAIEIMRRHVNKASGASFTHEQGVGILTDISPYPTFEKAAEVYYNPESPVDKNWRKRARWAINQRVKAGQLEPGQVKVDDLSDAQRLYYKLLDLKIETEQNVALIEKELQKVEGEGVSEIKELLKQVKYLYSIRDYVDSAELAVKALKAVKKL